MQRKIFAVAFGFLCVRCVSDAIPMPDSGVDSGAMTDGNVVMEAGPDAPSQDGCGAAPTTMFYVNGATGNDANNGGTATCAFKTISAALAASKMAYNATINVAAGTYSVGENFPLIVDHGRSLVGAGAMTTTIQGSSAPYNTSGTGSFLDYGAHYITMLVGDLMGGPNNLGATTISGITVLPSNVAIPTPAYVGMACIAGNAPNTGASPPLPMPSLLVKGVTVGPNFDVGLALGYSTSLQAACNPLVTASTFTKNNIGIQTGVCGFGGDGGAGNPVGSWPSSQIGSGMSADANTFSECIADIAGNGCGSIQQIDNNRFVSGYQGIILISNIAQWFEINQNTFDGSTGTKAMGLGIYTNAGATIHKLNDNTFTNISQSQAADAATFTTTGYAINLGGARVLQAYRNNINNNDNGIILGSGSIMNFDFSSGGVMNNTNQIYCNSKQGNGAGYDLVVPYSYASKLNFSGNTWDNSVPTTFGTVMGGTNGTDIVGMTASIDSTNGAKTMQACKGQRVH